MFYIEFATANGEEFSVSQHTDGRVQIYTNRVGEDGIVLDHEEVGALCRALAVILAEGARSA